jgi:hypothetical protein
LRSDPDARGQIIDENGEQLNGVRAKGYYQWMTEETGGTIKIDTMFDGAFEFSFTNCGVFELEFEKDGYYKAELTRSAAAGEPDWGGRKKLEEHDISVVMERQGELTVLSVLEMKLEFDVAGKVSMAEMKDDGTLSKTQVDDLNASGALPEHGIYLAAETSGSLIEIVDATNTYGDVVGAYPLAAKLVMCNSEDGFVGQETETQTSRDVLRRMKQAPATGYSCELPVAATGGSFFYFKMNSLYGKGYIASRRVSSETNACRTSLNLYLQENGSRNLENRHY